MTKKQALFIYLLFFSFCFYGQNTIKDTISVSQFVEDMVNYDGPGPGYKIRNKLIQTDFSDTTKKDQYFYYGLDPKLLAKHDSIVKARNYVVDHPVFIGKCDFQKDWYFVFRHIVFNKIVVLRDVNDFWGIFENCTFKGGLLILNGNSKNTINFKNCQFNGIQLSLYESSGIFFQECKFDQNKTDSMLTKVFTGAAMKEWYCGGIFPSAETKAMLSFTKCIFPKRTSTNQNKSIPNIFTFGGKLKSLILDENDFSNQIIEFSGLKIEDDLLVRKCKFHYPINVGALSLPKNTNFKWNKGFNLCVRNGESKTSEEYYNNPYIGKGDKQLKQQFLYDELLSGFNKFFKMYKDRGDMESANACYIEMKDLETRMLQYKYKKDKSLVNFFNLKINQFLEYFCDYGTNPAKSLIKSMYIILYFSIFYFFFYSSWDKINRGFFIKRYKNLIEYVTSNKKLEDFYNEKNTKEMEAFERFKSESLEARKKMPFLLHLIALPLYKFSLIKYQTNRFLFRKTDFFKQQWDIQPFIKRVLKGIMLYIAVLVYLLFIVLLRGINSLALSINTFSTLGFGDIPVTGLSRYVAIIEGFIGWFLLSIFSVSLISQILQL
ncbi:MAG: potassium channel family protein [Crocinitomicaceae bacterium]|nr:potassium channel family protein [Crocinitomicaceae bacterium]